MRFVKIAGFVVCAAAGIVTLVAQGQGQGQGRPAEPGTQHGTETRVVEHRMNPHDDAPTAGTTGTLSPITPHGGPVMGTPNVYLIWYGNWNQNNGSDNASGRALVQTFLSGLSGSPYFNINTTYGAPSGIFAVKGETSDAYSQGSRLNDRGVQSVVTAAFTSGRLPKDGNGIYFVLSSTDVAETTGFCSRYCGWHTYATIQGSNIKYAFIGNANRCLNACAAQTVSPNDNAGVDGMISVIAHELEEATTDPNLNAWYDSSGAENADKCAWTFGSSQTKSPNGSFYNMTLNSTNFLVQRNLDASNNKCYVGLGGKQ